MDFSEKSAALEELKENTIISAAISEDGKYRKFYVSEKKIIWIIEGFDDENVVVDGIELPQ